MRFRLLQARLPDDPVRFEERQAFAERLQVRPSVIALFDLLSDPPEVDGVIEGVDAVLVGGSGAFSVTGDAPWLRGFFDLMGGLATRGFPTFASCFGFQALVTALGGEVRTDEDNAEVGSFDIDLEPAAKGDPVFGGLPDHLTVQQGHKDRAVRLPAGVVNLARSRRCPYQALRVAGVPVWATQFHAELTAEANRTRFERYFDMYSKAFGDSEAHRMLEAFRPSPEANGLLLAFRRHLEDLHRA